MKSVLIVTHEFPPFHGGIATVALGLARGAAAAGYEVHVLAPAYDGGTAGADAAEPFGLTRFPGSTCSMLSVRKLSRLMVVCRREIAARSPDIVHAVDPAGLMALVALQRLRLVGPCFLTVHGTELLRMRTDLQLRLWTAGAFRRAACTSAVSESVRTLLLESFDVPAGRTHLSYPGISPHWLREPETDVDATRRSWGLGHGELALLTVARRVPDKGHDRVIGGLAELPEELRRRIVYVVAGSGPEAYGRELEEQARDGDVRLKLLGRITDAELLAAYDAAHLFTMLSRPSPQRFEGLGLVYLEAGARGLPSLACGTGGVREAVLDEESGVVLRADAPAGEVATALARLLENAELRAELGSAAREHSRAFDWNVRAAELYGRFSRDV